MSFVWTAGMANPEVIRGQVVVKDNTYKLAANGGAFKQGELIRITASGTIEVAKLDSDATGPVHGMALANSADYTAGDFFPVALFDGSTELAIQLAASTDQNDIAIGSSYVLAVASNKWTMTSTTNKGIAQVCDKESQSAWFDPKAEASVDMSRVIIKFTQANLDGRGAAS